MSLKRIPSILKIDHLDAISYIIQQQTFEAPCESLSTHFFPACAANVWASCTETALVQPLGMKWKNS